jgi:hypothetical protein
MDYIMQKKQYLLQSEVSYVWLDTEEELLQEIRNFKENRCCVLEGKILVFAGKIIVEKVYIDR